MGAPMVQPMMANPMMQNPMLAQQQQQMAMMQQ